MKNQNQPGWEFVDMVTIIVPRKPLMIQWRDALIESGDSPQDIGRIGGGGIKGWKAEVKPHINIVTINAMRDGKMKQHLSSVPDDVRNHLVIVDECHNLRGEKNRLALSRENCPREAVLGLSATPHPTAEARAVVESLCGPIAYSYRYGQALADGVIPPFKLNAVQVPLSRGESRDIVVLDQRIKGVMRDRNEAFDHGTRAHLTQIAKQLGMKRKRILNRCRSRFVATLNILNVHGPDTPTLLFHESIPDIERLAEMTPHLSPALYHSQQKKADSGLERFLRKETNHLYSCLSLTEGFNVPWVQVAVMMSGPNAPLRRIQTLGRCLRGKSDTPNEIYFLYVPGTKDETGLYNMLNAGDIPQTIQVNGDTISVVEHYRWSASESKCVPIDAPKPPEVFIARTRDDAPLRGKTEGRPTAVEIMESQRTGEPIPRLTCDECGRTFKGNVGLNDHHCMPVIDYSAPLSDEEESDMLDFLRGYKSGDETPSSD
tara:strand:- start:48 stop:1511 length:1464 start_codon:yes stop_codon:yes gene_type:complete